MIFGKGLVGIDLALTRSWIGWMNNGNVTWFPTSYQILFFSASQEDLDERSGVGVVNVAQRGLLTLTTKFISYRHDLMTRHLNMHPVCEHASNIWRVSRSITGQDYKVEKQPRALETD